MAPFVVETPKCWKQIGLIWSISIGLIFLWRLPDLPSVTDWITLVILFYVLFAHEPFHYAGYCLAGVDPARIRFGRKGVTLFVAVEGVKLDKVAKLTGGLFPLFAIAMSLCGLWPFLRTIPSIKVSIAMGIWMNLFLSWSDLYWAYHVARQPKSTRFLDLGTRLVVLPDDTDTD